MGTKVNFSNIGIGGFKSIFTKLKHLKELEELILEGNYIGFQKDYEILYKPLYSLKNLLILNLNEIGLEDKGLEELGYILNRTLEFLEVLLLDGNNLTSDSVSKLNFNKQKRLKVLSLANNKIDKNGIKPFGTINYKSLERLLLGYNSIENEGVCLIIKKIAEEKDNKIEELNFAKNLVDERICDYSPRIRPNEFDNEIIPKLRNIDIIMKGIQNDIEKKLTYWVMEDEFKNKLFGTKTILDNLDKLTKLKMINLSSNYLSIYLFNIDCYAFYLLSINIQKIKEKNMYLFLNGCFLSSEVTGHYAVYKKYYITGNCDNLIFI